MNHSVMVTVALGSFLLSIHHCEFFWTTIPCMLVSFDKISTRIMNMAAYDWYAVR